jgi:hypothetical protein
MTTTSQQQEFEAAIQLHIQQAVAAALAGLPPPTAPAPPTVNVNAVAVKLPEFWPADHTTWFHHQLQQDTMAAGEHTSGYATAGRPST